MTEVLFPRQSKQKPWVDFPGLREDVWSWFTERLKKTAANDNGDVVGGEVAGR